MSALFFGVIGTVFSMCWLIWMLGNERTPSRGLYRESVARSDAPGTYWGEVAFAGLFAILCLAIAGEGAGILELNHASN